MRSLHFLLCLLCLFVAHPLFADEPVFPGESWEKASPAEVGLDETKLKQARDYALTGGGSGYITRHGRLVMAWGDLAQRYDLKSTSKSIGVTALGIAIKDGKIKLDDVARKHHSTLGTPPKENEKSGWLDDITILHLATQTAGFEKPGGYTRLVFEPGTKWRYSDGGPNWLAECVTLRYERDIAELLFERVFTPIGITAKDLTWRNNAYRDRTINGVVRREFGSGVSANVDAMARIGLLYLRRGLWGEQRILEESFVDLCRQPVKQLVGVPVVDGKNHGDASNHYGLLWWNNADGTIKELPRDAYWSWGLYDSLIVVIPSLDIVVSRAGKSWDRKGWSGHYDVLRPFLVPIAEAVKKGTRGERGEQEDAAAEPRTGVRITRIEWAPPETILRNAHGGDNWPITWGDDDALYTAYGDGRGFKPNVDRKLSLGFAKVIGPPDAFEGSNIRSETGEQVGDGARGRKASGMLMIDGVLCMWVRNAGLSQLAWSKDRGATWTWANWKLEEGFAAPTLLNFGRDYAGVPNAAGGYAYAYSFDSRSAYDASDRYVLSRVPKDRITQRDAYEFLASVNGVGNPAWTRDIARRGAVFARENGCYRSGVSYNAGLKRYLWAQVLPGGDTRFKGGLAVAEAPQPWGPWTVVYETKQWDVGPGETASFPTKWMSADGRTVHLVFSGDDAFSVRRATLHTE